MPNIKKVTWEVNENGCWICTSHSLKNGAYPTIQQNHKRRRISHFMYEKINGTVPAGMLICHHCDNPACINPGHLFSGTNADNTADKMKKGRQSRTQGETNGNSRLNEHQIKEIRASEIPAKNLAQKYGISISQVNRIKNGSSWGCIEEGVLSKEQSRNGEMNPVAKLTNEQVKDIKRLKGLSQSNIAAIYGISQTHVSEIRLGKAWKHLDMEGDKT